MSAVLLDQSAELLASSDADLATLASPLRSDEDFANPNVVKVIVNDAGDAIYFSRATIPYPRDASRVTEARRAALHHHGIYAYRCGVLRRLVASDPSPLETAEQLEQRPGAGVDTEADLAAAARELAG